ncbi:MAG TPA: transporter substrate-binding domain-containing protein [Albitalea sp.]|nr:transporter substrate-binding domain-containing protein [Albitalea sp.]
MRLRACWWVWCLALGLHASAQARKLVLAATEYPPYYSESLDKGGPVAELTLTALRRAGHEVELHFMPWARALKWGEEGKVDGLVGVWRSPEREKAFFYSDAVVSNRIVLCRLGTHGPARFTTFEALEPYIVGVVRGYADPPGLAQAHIRTEPVTHDLQNLRKLAAGHVDLVLIDSRVGRYLIDKHLSDVAPAINCLQPAVQEHPQYLVISRGVPDGAAIVASFNRQLEQLRRSGEFDRIAGHWGW